MSNYPDYPENIFSKEEIEALRELDAALKDRQETNPNDDGYLWHRKDGTPFRCWCDCHGWGTTCSYATYGPGPGACCEDADAALRRALEP